MPITLDTIIIGTGITVLSLLTFVAALGVGIAFAWITYSAIRWFPIFLMQHMKAADKFVVHRKDGTILSYANGWCVLNIGPFSVVFVNGRSREDG